MSSSNQSIGKRILTHFQNTLNKIRNGSPLTDQEWNYLTVKKAGAAVKLMSRRKGIIACNEKCLHMIKTEAKSWEVLDSCRKLRLNAEEHKLCFAEIERKKVQHMDTLKDHRFPTKLTLKIGAKVVLLANINPDGGLVNGSQGEVIGFIDTKGWPPPKGPEGNLAQGGLERGKVREFQTKQGFLCPIIRFHKGNVTDRPLAPESLRGPSNDKYAVCRAQIRLTLAWALSIHESQGMTLSNVEVSSDAIFESGQLYVGLSRATSIEGLIITGYSREQLEMDKDVLELYQNAPWEALGPSNTATGVANDPSQVQVKHEPATDHHIKRELEDDTLVEDLCRVPKTEEFF